MSFEGFIAGLFYFSYIKTPPPQKKKETLLRLNMSNVQIQRLVLLLQLLLAD